MLQEGLQPFQREGQEVPYPVPLVRRVELTAQCQRQTLNRSGLIINMMRSNNSLITPQQVGALGETQAKINLPPNIITRISTLTILEAPIQRASKETLWEVTTTTSTITRTTTTITQEEGKFNEGITRCSSIWIAITSSPSLAPQLTHPRCSNSSCPSTTLLPANIMSPPQEVTNMAIMAATLNTGRNAWITTRRMGTTRGHTRTTWMAPVAVDTRMSINTRNTLLSRGMGSASMGRLRAINLIIDSRDSRIQRILTRLTRRAEICMGSNNIKGATASIQTTTLGVEAFSKTEGAREPWRPTRTTPNTTTTTASSSSGDSKVALGRWGATKRINIWGINSMTLSRSMSTKTLISSTAKISIHNSNTTQRTRTGRPVASLLLNSRWRSHNTGRYISMGKARRLSLNNPNCYMFSSWSLKIKLCR